MSTTLQHAELSIIGAVLLTDGATLDDLNFDPSSYSDKRLEDIHGVMSAMRNAGEPVNVLTVPKYASSNGIHADAALLHQAMSVTPTPSTASYYAKIVSDAAVSRQLQSTAEWIANQSANGADLEQVIEQAKATLDGARQRVGLRTVKPIGAGIETYVNNLEKTRVYYETPWPQINHLIGGLMPGALYVVGARPSVGKSVVALQLAQALEKHGSVAFVSLEMLEDDLRDRLFANEKKVPMQRLTAGQLNSSDWQRMSEWMPGITERRIYVSEPKDSTIQDIKRFIQDVNRTEPLAGVVIDYLQLISPSAGRSNDQEFLSDVTRQLKMMALQMNIPIVLLSQLNRGSANREDKMPRSSDLRGSGSIEQDADVVLLLHRDLKGDESYRMFMNVEKNRRGPAGNTEMVFQGHYSNIHDDLSN